MNLSLPAVVMFVAGMVLMYAAIHNKTPLEIVRSAFEKAPTGGAPPKEGIGEKPKPKQPSPPPNANPGVPWVGV